MRGILTYHSIDPSGSPISIDEAEFRAHVAWLATGAVRVVSLADVVSATDERDLVALTFDDAFASFSDIALPLLRDHGLPATLFVVSGHAGKTNAWGGREQDGIPTLPLMDWDAIGRARDAGVSIGAHSVSHPDLRRLSDARLIEETAGSAEVIAARTGVKPEAFAYPFGGVDEAARLAAGRAFTYAVTTALRAVTADDELLSLPRLDAYYFRTPGQIEGWGSTFFRARLSLRSGLRSLRQSMHRR